LDYKNLTHITGPVIFKVKINIKLVWKKKRKEEKDKKGTI